MSEGGGPEYRPSLWFWEVVGTGAGDRGRMREVLEGLAISDLLRFHYELEDAVAEFQDERFEESLGGVGEDGVLDVANWVVSQGSEYFEEVFAHPERVPRGVEDQAPGVLYDGITLTVFWERTGAYPPDRD